MAKKSISITESELRAAVERARPKRAEIPSTSFTRKEYRAWFPDLSEGAARKELEDAVALGTYHTAIGRSRINNRVERKYWLA